MVTTKAAKVVTSAAVGQEDALPEQNKDWVIEQQADPDIEAVKRYVEQGLYPTGPERKTLLAGAAKLLRQYKRLCVREGVVCRTFTDPNSRLCAQVPNARKCGNTTMRPSHMLEPSKH